MRARDLQRSAVYSWEMMVEQCNPRCLAKMSLGDCQYLIDRVWVNEKGTDPRGTPVATDGKARRSPCYSPMSHSIKLPVNMRYSVVVLHELAHALQVYDSAWHGHEFCSRLVMLWERYAGIPMTESMVLGLVQTPRSVKFSPDSLN